MSPCPLPFSTSGSISPRPIPIRPPCGSGRWPRRPMSACAFARSCSGRSSRRRAGPRRRSISIRQGPPMWRDLERLCADCPAVPAAGSVSANSLLAARVAWPGSIGRRGEDFCRAVFRAEFGEGRRIDDPAAIGDVLAGLQIDPGPVLAAAQSDAIKTRLREETERAAARLVRRAELHYRRRRIVLGQRPARARAPLGDGGAGE